MVTANTTAIIIYLNEIIKWSLARCPFRSKQSASRTAFIFIHQGYTRANRTTRLLVPFIKVKMKWFEMIGIGIVVVLSSLIACISCQMTEEESRYWMSAINFGLEVELHDTAKIAMAYFEYRSSKAAIEEKCYKQEFASSKIFSIQNDKESSGLCVFELITKPQEFNPGAVATSMIAIQAFRESLAILHGLKRNQVWERKSCDDYPFRDSDTWMKAERKHPSGCLPRLYTSAIDFPLYFTGSCVRRVRAEPTTFTQIKKCLVGNITKETPMCSTNGKIFRRNTENCKKDETCVSNPGYGSLPPNFAGWLQNTRDGNYVVVDDRRASSKANLFDLLSIFEARIQKYIGRYDGTPHSLHDYIKVNTKTTADQNGIFFVPSKVLPRMTRGLDIERKALGQREPNDEGIPYFQTNLDLPLVSVIDPWFVRLFPPASPITYLWNAAVITVSEFVVSQIGVSRETRSCAINMYISYIVIQLLSIFVEKWQEVVQGVQDAMTKNAYAFLPKGDVASLGKKMYSMWFHMTDPLVGSDVEKLIDFTYRDSLFIGKKLTEEYFKVISNIQPTLNIRSSAKWKQIKDAVTATFSTEYMRYLNSWSTIDNIHSNEEDYQVTIQTPPVNETSYAVLGIVVEDRRVVKTGHADFNFAFAPNSKTPRTLMASLVKKVSGPIKQWVEIVKRAQHFGCGVKEEGLSEIPSLEKGIEWRRAMQDLMALDADDSDADSSDEDIDFFEAVESDSDVSELFGTPPATPHLPSPLISEGAAGNLAGTPPPHISCSQEQFQSAREDSSAAVSGILSDAIRRAMGRASESDDDDDDEVFYDAQEGPPGTLL